MKEYFKQIDALRFYAVTGVMISHIYPSSLPQSDFLKTLYQYLPGVPLFFCISGFLITSILISNSINSPKRNLFKSFYIRRFLRIFPIYYLTIIGLLIININNYSEWFVYDFFYITNIKQSIQGSFDGSIAPHFWSLAVEEQFYIFWPILITLFRNRTYFMIASISIFMFGFLSLISDLDSFWINRTIGNLVYLGSGAILAVLWLDYKSKVLSLVLYLDIILTFFLLTVIVQSAIDWPLNPNLKFLIKVIIIPLTTLKFAIGFKSFAAKKLVENPFILYLGKISYGIYIFHVLVLFPALLLKTYLPFEFMESDFSMFLLKILLTIIISSLSWEFFEKKINKLKDRFSYS